MNKTTKKILIFLGFTLFAFIVSLILAYCFFCLIFNKGTFVFNIEFFSNKILWFLFIILFGAMIGVFAYVNIRYKIFDKQVVITKNDRVDSNLYDNQSFLTKDEMKKLFGYHCFNNILENEDTSGFVINSEWDKKQRNLYFSTLRNNHACLIGTTGTGKSTFIAGPTIQTCARSCDKPTLIINDISGELFRNHSKTLEENGYKIVVVNLHTPRKSLRFNPLSIVWDLYHEFIDKKNNGINDYELLDRCSIYINEIANFMCISGNKNNSDLTWQQGAKGIVQATIWAMLEDSIVEELSFTKDMFTIAQISNIINKQKSELISFLFDRNISSKTFDYAGNINANSSEKTVDSYLATLSTSLSLFLENGIQYLTSATDIDLTNIVEQPTAIFVIVPPEYPERYIISSMLYSQIYNNLVYTARTMQNGSLPRTVYYILDEFGNLPKIKDFPVWIATSRKMRIFFFIMLQSNKQLDNVYGKEQALIILNNCQANMFLGSSEFEDIERFKKLFGTYTALNRNQSYDTNKDTLGSFKGGTSLVKKDLVTTSDLQQIPQGTMYTYLLRSKPMKSTLVPIFDDNAQKFLNLGSAELEIKEHDFENIVYDLVQRREKIDAIVKELNSQKEWEIIKVMTQHNHNDDLANIDLDNIGTDEDYYEQPKDTKKYTDLINK